MSSLPLSQGHYSIASRTGETIFTAGMTPRNNGVLTMRGRVSAQRSIEAYREPVELAVGNALRAASSQLRDGERIARVLNMVVYVAAEDGYEAHSKIADFASDKLFSVLGDAGIGCRSAVGVHSLPGGAPVEISLVVSVRDP
ncbi:MAG: RidA family protein [Castellaniella sp.]|uniref:RidA family protein n=1 Tax=Castellaniella sp. TaxID=1955812 RepID=UPI003C756F55